MSWFIDRLRRTAHGDSLGLLRIGMALLLWTRFGTVMTPYYRPHPMAYALGAVFFVATTTMLVGFWSRTSTAITAATLWLGWLYVGHEVGMAEQYDHHHTRLLFAATAWLALSPCGATWSLDRFLAVRKARLANQPTPSTVVPVWALDLLALQVSTVYLWSAWDKSQWAFMSGERLEHMLMRWYLFDYPSWPLFHEACMAMAWVTVLLEYVLPFALFSRRLQPVLIPIGLLLHAIFFVVLPVGTFSCTMMLLYIAYVDPNAVKRVLDQLTHPSNTPSPGHERD